MLIRQQGLVDQQQVSLRFVPLNGTHETRLSSYGPRMRRVVSPVGQPAPTRPWNPEAAGCCGRTNRRLHYEHAPWGVTDE